MGIRGRKTAALAVMGSGGVIPRPMPPDEESLTDEQAQEWDAVVNRLPADWFPRETHGLLAQYCRHVITARRVATLIKNAESGAEMDIENYDRLLKMQEREGRAMSSLATRMRISQQSTYNEKKTKPALTLNPFED